MAPKSKSRPYNDQDFHAVAEPPKPNTTNKPSDRFVATVHSTESAAQDAQNVSQPDVPANHHGMDYPNIIPLKIQREHNKSRCHPTSGILTNPRHDSAAQINDHKRRLNKQNPETMNLRVQNFKYPNLNSTILDIRKIHGRDIGDASHLSSKRPPQRRHAILQLTPTAGRPKPKTSETTKMASRHTYSQLTHSRNNMAKQTRASKSKRALLAGNATGNTVQINIHSLTSKLADKPNANANEVTPSLDAASSHLDVALTFQGNDAGEPAATPRAQLEKMKAKLKLK